MVDDLVSYHIIKQEYIFGTYADDGDFWLTNKDGQRILHLKRETNISLILLQIMLAITIYLVLISTIAYVFDYQEILTLSGQNMLIAIIVIIMLALNMSSIIPSTRFSVREVNNLIIEIGSLISKRSKNFILKGQNEDPIKLNFSDQINDLRIPKSWKNPNKHYSLLFTYMNQNYHTNFRFDFPRENEATVEIVNSESVLITYSVDNVFEYSKLQKEYLKVTNADPLANYELIELDRKYGLLNRKSKINAIAATSVEKDLVLCCGAMLMDYIWQMKRPTSSH
ncbi:MAG: hypothetical protein GPJ54_13035 [Candidatus Heimdallarchaeota archaeon]|nr:hypothetical protein [Candidatus Heimdallarchaeota archaeon]